jgi:phosphoribosylamine---glycine ligase
VKVLLVGGGGREHALAWKIVESPRVERVYAAPGNPGIARLAQCVPIAIDRPDELTAFAERERIDLVVVGPEAPLVAGLADRLRDRGLAVFGPSARAAAIEGSKAFAKALMDRHGVPTARFGTFTDARAARAYGRDLGAPLVVKASGLAAGKGAIVCRTLAEADEAVSECMERRAFGPAGDTVVIEEFLEGEELSFFAVCNGTAAVTLGAAQDHKTVFDDDRGPNTGGMGAYAPVTVLDDAMERIILDTIVRPTLGALAAEGAAYRGVLFAGLMLTKDGPKVIEFNCRFGDPECQVILARLTGDVVPSLLAAARGEPVPPTIASTGAAVCVTLASGGYPGPYPTGIPVHGIADADALPGVRVFHAGTAARGDTIVTAGGRVLGVTAAAGTIADAVARAYEAVGRIRFDGMHYRRDIGRRALSRG